MKKNIFKGFDYIYYRLNRFYFRWDGVNGSTSLIGLSLMQSLSIFIIILLAFRNFITKQQLTGLQKPFVGLILFLLFGIWILNSYKYKNRYHYFETYWSKETRFQKRYRGILVILALVFPIIVGIVFSIVNSKSV